MSESKRTAAGLREKLLDLMDGVIDETVDPLKAKTVALLAMTVIKTVEVEMAFRAQVASLGKNGNLDEIGTLPLAELPAPKPTREIRDEQTYGPRFVKGKVQSASR